MHWLPDLFRFYSSTWLLRAKTPFLASFKLTHRCNLQCLACPYHLRSGAADTHMDWDTAVACLQKLKQRGCRIVVFEGGEPMLWTSDGRNFSELASYARTLFLRVAVTTNGTFELNAPADVLWVSLDGAKATHDRLRSDSYDQVLANLKAVRHPNVLIHFTANNENIDDLEAVAALVQKLPSVRGTTVQFHYPYDDGEAPLALTQKQRERAIETVLRLKKQGAPILNSTGGLKAMLSNAWTCREWMLINVDPNGAIAQGCYVKSRGIVDCDACGFTPVAELSRSWTLHPGSVLAGWRVFLSKR